ncbi:MAG: hypothetical protein RLZZ344_63 [Pseudomonadota bacterium]|jgi:hypothetical protein
MIHRLAGTLALVVFLGGCVVRTQDFHCIREDDAKTSFELRMSPTSIEIKGVGYSFDAEQGAERRYRNQSTGQTVVFNPASGRLVLSERPMMDWTCERYESY